MTVLLILRWDSRYSCASMPGLQNCRYVGNAHSQAIISRSRKGVIPSRLVRNVLPLISGTCTSSSLKSKTYINSAYVSMAIMELLFTSAACREAQACLF